MQLTDDESEKRQVVWAPDSSKLAYTAGNTLLVNDSLTADSNRVIGINAERGYQLGEFSPDGNWLVYSRARLRSEHGCLRAGSGRRRRAQRDRRPVHRRGRDHHA